jgi:hypothetical protein
VKSARREKGAFNKVVKCRQLKYEEASLCKRWTNFSTRKLSERLETFRRTRAETYLFEASGNYSLHKVLRSLLNIKSNIENKIRFVWKPYAFEAHNGIAVISTYFYVTEVYM